MQRSILFLCLGFFMISCHKDGSNNGSAGSSTDYLSSVTSYGPRTKIIDSITYDKTNRVTRFAQYAYDTSSGYPQAYSWWVDFTLPTDGSAPSSYTYSDAQVSDPHKLAYDGQGRIIKDTSLSGSGFVTYYSYSGSNNIAIKVLFDGSPLNNQIDTLFLNNGNIGSEHIYLPNDAGTADSLEGNLQIGYSSAANPAYHSDLSANIGALLHTLQFDGYGNFMDPISQRAYNSVGGAGDGFPTNAAISYTQTTDGKGRLSQMTASVGGLGTNRLVFNYY